MKNLSKRIIQLVLLAVAGYSFSLCIELGNKYEYDEGGLTQYINRQNMTQSRKANNINKESKATDITSQSGFNGGALGMGIICASSLLGIVLLEIKSHKNE